MGNQEQRVSSPRPGGNLAINVAIILMVIAIVWLMKLAYDQKVALQNLNETTGRIAKALKIDGDEPRDKPGPAPIISVGPKTEGGSTLTDWKKQQSGVQTDVTFGASLQLREDVQGEKEKFLVEFGEAPSVMQLNSLNVKLENGEEITVSLSGDNLVWGYSGGTLTTCDWDELETGGDPPHCEGDGIPPEFDGELAAETPFATSPTVSDFVEAYIKQKQE